MGEGNFHGVKILHAKDFPSLQKKQMVTEVDEDNNKILYREKLNIDGIYSFIILGGGSITSKDSPVPLESLEQDNLAPIVCLV